MCDTELGLEHMVGNTPSRLLPTRLLAALRILLMDDDDFVQSQISSLQPLAGPVGDKHSFCYWALLPLFIRYDSQALSTCSSMNRVPLWLAHFYD